MPSLRTLSLTLLAPVALVASYIIPATAPTSAALTITPAATSTPPAQLSLSVEPLDDQAVVYRAVTHATTSISLEIYELADATLESALIARSHAGVKVRVLLDSAYSGASVNASAYATLHAAGVAVAWAPSSTIYHAKFIVIDRRELLVGTGNLTAQWYATTRDFWVADTNTADVESAQGAFDADFAGKPPSHLASADLVYSPGASSRVLALIASAHRTLDVENEEMASSPVIAALVAAAHRHVAVHVTMTYSSSWYAALSTLRAAGVSVHVYHGEYPVYIHAKVICADCTPTTGTAFVGSQNFSTASLTYNRELGIITTASSVVQPLRVQLAADFAAASGL
jgi:phosphatidylserine/phosphatidylglycerophosphate/cardiolipin synthase-like enzyme